MPDTERSDIMAASDKLLSLREFLLSSIQAHKVNCDLQFRLLDQRMDSASSNMASRMEALEAKITARLDGMENAADLALHSHEQALLKAEAMTERRFASVNEFREMLNDVVARSMPRSEANLLLKSLQENLAMNTERLNLTQGAGQGAKSIWLFLVGLIAAVAGSASIVLILMSGAG